MTGSSKPTKGLEHFKPSKNYLIRVLKSSDHDKWIGLIICMPQSIYLNNFLLNHPFCAYLMNREENLEPRFDILVLELAISIVYWLFHVGYIGNIGIVSDVLTIRPFSGCFLLVILAIWVSSQPYRQYRPFIGCFNLVVPAI